MKGTTLLIFMTFLGFLRSQTTLDNYSPYLFEGYQNRLEIVSQDARPDLLLVDVNNKGVKLTREVDTSYMYGDSGEVTGYNYTSVFYVNPDTTVKRFDVGVYAVNANNNELIELCRKRFRVEPLPLPKFSIAAHLSGSSIPKQALGLSLRYTPDVALVGGTFNKLKSYTVSIKGKKIKCVNENLDSPENFILKSEVSSLMQKLKKGDSIKFDDIIVVMPSGREEKIEPATFKIM